MKSRLTQFLQSEQLSPARFADILGVQRSGISHILSGRNKPGFDLIEKILNKFSDINAEWLITGKGKMYKDEKTEPALPTSSTLFSETPPVACPTTQPLPQLSPQLSPQEKSVSDERCIHKIVILYSDKSFSEYHPE